jgi:hypothetical protein
VDANRDAGRWGALADGTRLAIVARLSEGPQAVGQLAAGLPVSRITRAGTELRVVLSALQQWGDKYLPPPDGPSVLRRIRGTDLPVHVGYVDDQGNEVALADVAMIPAG